MSDPNDYWADVADRQPSFDRCRQQCDGRQPILMADADFRRFELVRHEDPTGVSGTGVVARGVEFPSGAAVLEWDAANHDIDAVNGLAIKPAPDGVDAVLEIHGHDGSTGIRWLDDVADD